jgi:hypothetical protein
MRVNRRVMSSLGLAAILVAGTVASFGPFYRGTQDMKAFCASLEPGASIQTVRTQARAQGYLVSYESRFVGPDGGTPLVEDTGRPLREASVEDPQLPLLNCLLTFAPDGNLASAHDAND